MRITGTNYETKIIFENPDDDLSLDRVIDDMIRPLLYAMGYASEAIDQHIPRE